MLPDLFVASTSEKTVGLNPRWIAGLWTNTSLAGTPPRTCWAFTDGAGNGAHAAVLVWPQKGQRRVRRLYREKPTTTRNVSAEIDGVGLAIESVVDMKDRTTGVIVVSDFLWTAAYLKGVRNVHNAEVKERVAAILTALGDLELAFVHHPGHGKDQRVLFTRYNCMADAICSGKPTEFTEGEVAA